ncbi:hypothetical protein MTO96_025759 [Rhipicephalus appendiculatus]
MGPNESGAATRGRPIIPYGGCTLDKMHSVLRRRRPDQHIGDGAFQGSALIGHSSGVEAPPSFIYGLPEREAPSSPLSQDDGVAVDVGSLRVLAESSQKSNAWSSLSGRSSRRPRRVWSGEERPAVTRLSSSSSRGCGPRFCPERPGGGAELRRN